jgi:hypothetical protein
MTKQYYMFIPLDIDKDKNTRFVVETDGIIPTDKAFSGKVVARNKKANWYLGAESDNWVNPIVDMMNGNKPSFLPINQDEVIAKFEEHCIEE